MKYPPDVCIRLIRAHGVYDKRCYHQVGQERKERTSTLQTKTAINLNPHAAPGFTPRLDHPCKYSS